MGRLTGLVASTFAALVVAFGMAAKADAIVTTTIDIKEHYSTFVAGSTIDLPIYFVENRSAVEESLFFGGGNSLRSVYFDLELLGSEVISFTYDPRFTQTFNFDDDHHVWAGMDAPVGIPATVDNSGIVGRTEAQIGVLRLKVGPAIKHGDQWIVFDMNLNVDPSYLGGSRVPSYRTPAGGNVNWTQMGTRQMRFYADEPPGEELLKCLKAKAAQKKANKKAKKAKKAAARANKKVKKAAPAKKAALKKKAKKAKASSKKLAKKAKKAKTKTKKACR